MSLTPLTNYQSIVTIIHLIILNYLSGKQAIMKEPGLRIPVLMYETKNKTKQNLEWNMLVSDS